MKKLTILLAACVSLMSCGNQSKTSEQDNEASKSLIIYYSQTGSTKTVADELQKQLNCDIESINAENPYSGDFNSTITRCQQEKAQNELPKLSELKSQIADYDTNLPWLSSMVWRVCTGHDILRERK